MISLCVDVGIYARVVLAAHMAVVAAIRAVAALLAVDVALVSGSDNELSETSHGRVGTGRLWTVPSLPY